MPKRRIARALVIVGSLLAPIGVWMLFRSGGVKDSSEQISFPQVSLPVYQSSLDGEVDFKKGRMVVIAFSPTDCETCLEVLTLLNEMHNNNQNALPIVGIIGSPYRQAVAKIQERYGLSFPILYDRLSSVRNSLTDEPKPLLMLLSDGMIEKRALVGAPESVHEVKSILAVLVSN
jgi:peroxiredoxin